MATILELVSQGILHEPDLDEVLGPREFPDRKFYASERLKRWIEEQLPLLGSTWKIEEEPDQQFDVLLNKYISGKSLAYQNEFWPLNPLESGVWEIKTADLRIFGWFAVMDCFVAVVADTAQRVKDIRLYAGYCGEVLRFREQLNLNPPKFIEGREPKNVISNFAYP